MVRVVLTVVCSLDNLTFPCPPRANQGPSLCPSHVPVFVCCVLVFARADLVRVLGEKEYNLVEQTIKLLNTEGLSVTFTEDGIDTIAHFAEQINRLSQDIGARRLNTVMHRYG